MRYAWPAMTVRLVGLPALAAVLLAAACGGGAASDAVPSPLHQTFDSPEALAEGVLAALADGDRATLEALPLSELEFRTVVWPELPSSRPERGLTFDYVWGDLHQKSNNEMRRLINRHGGKRYTLVDLVFDGETTLYETYRVHRETVLTVRDEMGGQQELAFFGSILERDGEFKLFSYVID